MPRSVTQRPADPPAPPSPASPPRRSILGFILLLAVMLLPAGIYAFYVLAQLEDVRRADLRGLDSAARAAEELLVSSRTTVRNLLQGDAPNREFACEFFQRQAQLALREPTDCLELRGRDGSGEPLLEAVDGGLFFTDGCSGGNPASPSGNTAADCVRIEVVLRALLAQVPFGESFDQLLVADDKSLVAGEAVSRQRGSPLLPPRVLVRVPPAPVRALSIAPVERGSKDTPSTEATSRPAPLQNATFVRDVDVAGTRFALMCQPWRIELGAPAGAAAARVGDAPADARQSPERGAATWSMCGLKDSRRSFREALEVAPNVVLLLLAFLLLAVVSTPILKVLSLAPQERLRFADMYLLMLGTLGLVMLLSAGVADLASYAGLRERSAERLRTLAERIEASFRAEIRHMHDQLADYDAAVASWLASTPEAHKTRVGCLLLEPEARSGVVTCEESDSPLSMRLPPTSYRYLQTVFWARPCDGAQIIKGTTGFSNTPLINIGQRPYFQAIERDAAWRVPGRGPMFLDAGVSFTTGGYFVALSTPSALTYEHDAVVSLAENKDEKPSADCTAAESRRFVAALTSQPVSTRYPVLAPGVGFAIVDATGHVVAHSDERRATYENLLDDGGLAARLRAALATRSKVDLNTYYLTRQHQMHVRPMADLPWTIVTFADDEVLRTLHVDLLGRTSALIVLYLLFALGGTLLYMLLHGGQPPVWMWPRREHNYRLAYRTAVWSLVVQLAVFLVAVDLLSGLALLAVSIVMPAIAIATVALVAGAANRPDRKHLKYGSLITAAIAIGVGMVPIAVEQWLDPVAAAHARPGLGVMAAIGLMLLFFALWRLPKRVWRRVLRSNPLAPHTTGTVLFWLAVGALPAYGLFQFAFMRQMTVATMAEQAYVGRAQAWRACRIVDDARLVASSDNASYVRQRISLGETGYTDVYPIARLATPAAAPVSESWYDDSRRASTRFWELFADLAPVYNETTTFFRYLDTPPAGRWAWVIPAAGSPVLHYVPESTDTCDARVATIASEPLPTEPTLTPLRLVAGIVFLGLLGAWVSYGTRRLFFGAIEDDVCVAGPRLDAHRENLGKQADLAWLEAEVDPLRDDAPISAATLESWLARPSTRRIIADRILERARPHYEALWKSTDDDEKLVLVQLAQEGFANPKQTEVVRRLLRKGLLRRDPILRLMNHSFALFVESTVDTADVVRREHAHRGLRWSNVRTLLIAAFVLVLLFLSFTQRDTVQAWLAYLTTAAGLAAGVFKLVGFVSRPTIPKE